MTDRRLDLRLMALLTAAALAVRLPLLTQPLWFDEIFSTSIFLKNFVRLTGTLLIEGALPFYYVFMFFWIRLFGDGEISVRLPALLAGLLSVPLLYAAARRLSDRLTSFLAALFLALSPAHIWYSVEARPYAFLVFFVLCGAYSYWKLIERPRAGRWDLAFVASMAAAAWSHYYAGVFLLAACALCLKRRAQAGERVATWTVLILAPLAVYFLVRNQIAPFPRLHYLRDFSPLELWRLFFNWFLCGNAIWRINPYSPRLAEPGFLGALGHFFCQAVFFVYFLNGVWTLLRQRNGLGTHVVCFLAAVPLLLLLLSGAGLRETYIERSAIASLPFYALVMACGFTAVPGRLKAVSIGLLGVFQLFVLALFFLNGGQWTVYKPKVDFRSAAAYLKDERMALGPHFIVLSATGATELYYYDRGLPDSDAIIRLRGKVAAAADFVSRKLGDEHPIARCLRKQTDEDEFFISDPQTHAPHIRPPLSLRDEQLSRLRRVYLVTNKFWTNDADMPAARLERAGFSISERKYFSGVTVQKFEK